MHQAHDGADDAHRRREAAGLVEHRGADVVAGDHAVDLGFQHLADKVRVDAVDDQLKALAGELVVDLGDTLVERQQAFAARLLGQRDEKRHTPGHIRGLGLQDQLVQRG